MDYNAINYLVIAAIGLVSLFLFLMMYQVDWAGMGKRLQKRRDAVEVRLKNRSKGYFSYTRIDDELRGRGVYYMFGEDAVNPVTWLILKFVISLAGAGIGISLAGSLAGALLGPVAFFMPDILVKASNDKDNEDMMMDIKRIFDTLKIQTVGSVHLTNALLECYMVVSNVRLKRELQKMSAYILGTNDIATGVERFQSRFENRYIDSLCMTLVQAQENGSSVQLLDDLSERIANMQDAMNMAEQQRLERKIQAFELMVLAVSLLGGIYFLAVSFSISASSF